MVEHSPKGPNCPLGKCSRPARVVLGQQGAGRGVTRLLELHFNRVLGSGRDVVEPLTGAGGWGGDLDGLAVAVGVPVAEGTGVAGCVDVGVLVTVTVWMLVGVLVRVQVLLPFRVRLMVPVSV